MGAGGLTLLLLTQLLPQTAHMGHTTPTTGSLQQLSLHLSAAVQQSARFIPLLHNLLETAFRLPATQGLSVLASVSPLLCDTLLIIGLHCFS